MIVLYNLETGKIEATLEGASVEKYKKTHPTCGVLESNLADIQLHYIQNDNLSVRPKMPIVLDTETNTVTNVPENCLVTIEGERYSIPESTLELSFEYSGKYTVSFSCFPYLDKEVVIEITS